MVPESKRNDAAVKAVQAAIDLAEQAQSVGPIAELEQKVAANPLDHQARFDLATALNAMNKRAEATEQLLAIVKRDRKWNDDGARKQLLRKRAARGLLHARATQRERDERHAKRLRHRARGAARRGRRGAQRGHAHAPALLQ
jgi:thioredoxin-like negative regulator of GroEL